MLIRFGEPSNPGPRNIIIRRYTYRTIGEASLPREGYTSISIPDEMVREVDLIVKQKKYGYSSRADFIADAIRRLQRELKPLQK
jgi:hypothetical protein